MKQILILFLPLICSCTFQSIDKFEMEVEIPDLVFQFDIDGSKYATVSGDTIEVSEDSELKVFCDANPQEINQILYRIIPIQDYNNNSATDIRYRSLDNYDQININTGYTEEEQLINYYVIEFYIETSSGSNSLADRAGVEGYQFTTQYYLKVFSYPPPELIIKSIAIEEGLLNIDWTYTHKNAVTECFISRQGDYYSSSNNSFPVDTTFVDYDYTGGDIYYTLTYKYKHNKKRYEKKFVTQELHWQSQTFELNFIDQTTYEITIPPSPFDDRVSSLKLKVNGKDYEVDLSTRKILITEDFVFGGYFEIISYINNMSYPEFSREYHNYGMSMVDFKKINYDPVSDSYFTYGNIYDNSTTKNAIEGQGIYQINPNTMQIMDSLIISDPGSVFSYEHGSFVGIGRQLYKLHTDPLRLEKIIVIAEEEVYAYSGYSKVTSNNLACLEVYHGGQEFYIKLYDINTKQLVFEGLTNSLDHGISDNGNYLACDGKLFKQSDNGEYNPILDYKSGDFIHSRPQFTENSEYLIFIDRNGTEQGVFILNLENNKKELLFSTSSSISGLSYGYDGYISFETDRERMHIRDIRSKSMLVKEFISHTSGDGNYTYLNSKLFSVGGRYLPIK
jgi:hypothetical protein